MSTLCRAFMALSLIAMPLVFGASMAKASELPPLLEHALARGEAANQIRWAFTTNFQNNNADLTFRFQPFGERHQFTLLQPQTLSSEGERIYARLSEDEDADRDITHQQARQALGDQHPLVVEETDDYIIYEVQPQPWDDLDSDEVGLIGHLRAQMTVDKADGFVSQIRLYNPEPFHAMVVARVDEFEEIMTFEPEPVTGLPLMVSLRQEIRGRALFQRLHQLRQETYSDFVPMAEQGVELACLDAICVSEFLSPE